MYFMTSPATAMTLVLEMMDEAARDAQRQSRGRAVRAGRSARRTRAANAAASEQPASGWRLARVLHLAH